ncbi:MAG: cytochrome b/b6 domain-containing protein [Ignavibacteriales bacterium]|nr:cytochrome b/b6 domain-containing protein [Ignavibacteriales bacterium]
MKFPGVIVRCVALPVGLVLLCVGSVTAQDKSECLACHEDQSLTAEKNGKAHSLFLDDKKFSKSIHNDLQCVSCHEGFDPNNLPHKEKIEPVQCGTCHTAEQEQYAQCMHGERAAAGDPLAPRCYDCHGKHDILAVKDPNSQVRPINIPYVCGKCHQEGAPVQKARRLSQEHILENYTESIHGEGLLKKGLSVAATCASCHTPHLIRPHNDPRSSINRKNIAATCAKCHSSIEVVHRKVIKGELWEKQANVLPACVDCHQPHKARRVFYDQGMANKDCLTCHERKDIKASKDGRSLFVDVAEYAGSKHGAKVACSQCHTEVKSSHTRPCDAITKKVDCAQCHTEVGEQYQKSTHGKLFAKQDANAPTCKECHGTHGVKGKTDPISPTFAINVPALCARCHQEGQKAAVRYKGTEHDIIKHYTESIHGKGLAKSGLTVTAKCTDCHSSHMELPKSDPLSTINAQNIPATCGRCHHGIEEKYNKSIHSRFVSTSEKPLPVCNDCHTAHTINRTDAEGFKLGVMTTCGKCHDEITKTYFDTYHGKVAKLGYTKTAKCYDCHGAHDILPTSNPNSRLHRQNVVQTCQQCHPGANRRFAGYLTHATHHDPDKYPILFWVFWGMTGLVIGTFFFSGVHTLLWLPRAWELRRIHQQMEKEHGGERQYQRFSRLNRILHIAMIVSFLSLALTGMMLKFSYTDWAAILSRFFGGFEVAGYIHRIAATFMMIVFITHIVDLVRRKKVEFGSWKKMLFGANTMLPTKKDLQDIIGSIKWFIGKGPRPQYGRWTYWEKFDYFAVFWGVFIIGSTGMTLWFPEFFTNFVPGWFINVATIIHSDEALLATGFIFTVHFFNTHLRPEKFPMDLVIFTGRMSVEELKRDKPAEYYAMIESGELEKHLVEPYHPIVLRAIKIFGWTAVTIGFSVVLWIIYAMIFSYQ